MQVIRNWVNYIGKQKCLNASCVNSLPTNSHTTKSEPYQRYMIFNPLSLLPTRFGSSALYTGQPPHGAQHILSGLPSQPRETLWDLPSIFLLRRPICHALRLYRVILKCWTVAVERENPGVYSWPTMTEVCQQWLPIQLTYKTWTHSLWPSELYPLLASQWAHAPNFFTM